MLNAHRMAEPSDTPPTTEMLIEGGKYMWEHSYRLVPEDHDDPDAAAFMVLQGKLLGTRAYAALNIPNEQLMVLWMARWYDQGLPVVTLGHKYSAALMATSISKEVGDYVKPPWKAFLIHLPAGLLSTASLRGSTGITRVVVHYVQNSDGSHVWNWSAFGSTDPTTLYSYGNNLERLLSDDQLETNDGPVFLELTESDERVSMLIGRLIVGVCLGFSDPNNVKPQGPRARSYPHTQVRKHKEPTTRTFILGGAVKVDCRQAVREYVAGTTTHKLSVQVLVRGHWRAQVHGVKRSLRKVIWIEPFWRGPEDAPILAKTEVKDVEPQLAPNPPRVGD